MKALSSIFSSSAKVEVLGLLSRRPSPLPLRHVSYLTELPVRSVELAVENLCKNKILRRKKSGKLILVSFNEQHPLALVLKEIFEVISKHSVSPQENLDSKAQEVLAFVDSTNAFFRQVKLR